MISLNSYWETDVQPALNTFFAGFSGMVSVGGGYNYYGAGLHYRWENAKDNVNANFAKIALDYSITGLRTITNNDFDVFVTDVNYNINLISSISLSVVAPAVVWEDDYAKITITDQTSGNAQHEIWEDVDSEGYVLVTTLAAGTLIYNNYTYQNASVDIKIRARIGLDTSEYSSVVNIITPLVFTIDQRVLKTLTFNNFTSSYANRKINIDWGDGDVLVDYLLPTTSGLFPVSHDYAATGIYFVKITGEVDYIYKLEAYINTLISQTKITRWKFPRIGVFTHLYGNGFNGDIGNWKIPINLYGLHVGGNNLTGDVTNWDMSTWYRCFDFHIENNQLEGDVTNWSFGALFAHIRLDGNTNLEGDITNWVIPLNPVYGSRMYGFADTKIKGNLSGWNFPDAFHYFNGENCEFWGDLSSWNIGLYTGEATSIRFGNITNNKNAITGLPRGNFEHMGNFDFRGNNCGTIAIDDFLVYLDAFFTGGITPQRNCIYNLSGDNMGAPSAIGLAARDSIIIKYQAAAKTIAILTTSSTLTAIAPTVVWENDYAKITVTDQTGGIAEHEIWESVNGEPYTLVFRISAGSTVYNYNAWQNATILFKIRAKLGNEFSVFSEEVSIITPFVFKVNQTALQTCYLAKTYGTNTIRSLHTNKFITIYWGDGTSTVDFPLYGNTSELTHDYTVTGNYFAQIYGDLDFIQAWFLLGEGAVLGGTDMSKWILPRYSGFILYWSGNNLIGNMETIKFPTNLGGWHNDGNNFTGDISNWFIPSLSSMIDFHHQNNNAVGDVTNWVLGANISHIFLSQNLLLTGNVTKWQLPLDLWPGGFMIQFYDTDIEGDIGQWTLPVKTHSVWLNNSLVHGDLFNWQIPEAPIEQIFIRIGNTGVDKRTKITRLPRGHFKNVAEFYFRANDVPTIEIDAFLVYVDDYFVGIVEPLRNCVYNLSGTGMGIPTAAGLAAKASIEAKYTAAGKTISIAVNS